MTKRVCSFPMLSIPYMLGYRHVVFLLTEHIALEKAEQVKIKEVQFAQNKGNIEKCVHLGTEYFEFNQNNLPINISLRNLICLIMDNLQ